MIRSHEHSDECVVPGKFKFFNCYTFFAPGLTHPKGNYDKEGADKIVRAFFVTSFTEIICHQVVSSVTTKHFLIEVNVVIDVLHVFIGV